jgi:hypothetical protein
MTVSCRRGACEHFGRGPGVSLMMIVMLVVGIGCLLAGLLAIGFGIPVQEFSFGNTLILSGAVTACTGLVILGLWVVVGELKDIARRLSPGVHPDLSLDTAATALQPAASAAPRTQAPGGGGFLFNRDQPAPDDAAHAETDAQPSAPPPAPWLEEAAARDRARSEAPPVPQPPETAPAVKQRRNLLFSSTSRRERERTQTRPTDPSATEFRAATSAAPPIAESSEVQPPTFDHAWPKSERSRGGDAPPWRAGRAPSTFPETTPEAAGDNRHPSAARTEDQPPVTVLKSGVVDGMAYSLYSDGSIEAQMPEGMMRFASIDELRRHLDQRP